MFNVRTKICDILPFIQFTLNAMLPSEERMPSLEGVFIEEDTVKKIWFYRFLRFRVVNSVFHKSERTLQSIARSVLPPCGSDLSKILAGKAYFGIWFDPHGLNALFYLHEVC